MLKRGEPKRRCSEVWTLGDPAQHTLIGSGRLKKNNNSTLGCTGNHRESQTHKLNNGRKLSSEAARICFFSCLWWVYISLSFIKRVNIFCCLKFWIWFRNFLKTTQMETDSVGSFMSVSAGYKSDKKNKTNK